jgi:protocatechuate 3,4-dioxygenase beta subunit
MFPCDSLSARQPLSDRPVVRATSFPSTIHWAMFLLCIAALLTAPVMGQVPVLTWHYDNARSGVNTAEALLTPANVSAPGSFAKLFSQPVDGFVVGHPLYVPGLTIPGKGVHNVVFVATMHDTVYAFDADSATGPNAAPLWSTSLLSYSPPGATPTPITVRGGGSITKFVEVGVVSTPVIDLASHTMYLVADSYENGNVVHRLHALDITTGLEKLGGPTTIAATFTVNGVTQTFADLRQMNRPGLLLANNHIYIGWGGNGGNQNDQGWVMSYNATTLQPEGAFCTEPGAGFAAIWQKGGGLSADSEGNVYAETGEGQFSLGTNFPESVLKFSQVGTNLALTDWFTPSNFQALGSLDLDLNDAVLILPDQPGPHPHEAIAVGKEGTVYVLDRDNLGQFCATCTTTDTQIVQELTKLINRQTGTPILWNNMLYFTPQASPTQAFPLVNGQIVPTAAIKSIKLTGGGHPIITSKGNSNGVLWMMNAGALWALDASTLKTLGKFAVPLTAHFATPISADGKVFVGTQTSLEVFGLLPGLAPAAGNQQTAAVATTLPVLLKAQLRDPYGGTTFAGVPVAFSDGGKGGTFSNPNGVTDNTGTVSTSYTFPTKSGTYTITATTTGFGPATFTETATAGSPAKLARSTGNNQTAPVLTTLPVPVTSKVTDQYGNAVPGVSVSYTDGTAGGTFSANPVLSDSKGFAAVSYTTSTKAGKVSIKASATGLPVLGFTETVTAGPASAIAVVSGDNQTALHSTTLAQPLVVKVTDQYGNPVVGASVTFDDSGAGGSFSVNPATTGTAGTASVTYTAGSSPGAVTIRATVSGVSTPATFTEIIQ